MTNGYLNISKYLYISKIKKCHRVFNDVLLNLELVRMVAGLKVQNEGISLKSCKGVFNMLKSCKWCSHFLW